MTNNKSFPVPTGFLNKGYAALEYRGFEVPTSMLSGSKEIVVNTLPKKELKELAKRMEKAIVEIRNIWMTK